MHNANWAERWLGLVMPREKAATVAGDLMEDAQTQGAWWFRRHLVSTVLWALLAEISRKPVRLAACVLLADFLCMAFLPLINRLPVHSTASWIGLRYGAFFLISASLIALLGRRRELAFGLAWAVAFNWLAYCVMLTSRAAFRFPFIALLDLEHRALLLLAALLVRIVRLQREPISLPKPAR